VIIAAIARALIKIPRRTDVALQLGRSLILIAAFDVLHRREARRCGQATAAALYCLLLRASCGGLLFAAHDRFDRY
jgi:hypothetical protein